MQFEMLVVILGSVSQKSKSKKAFNNALFLEMSTNLLPEELAVLQLNQKQEVGFANLPRRKLELYKKSRINMDSKAKSSAGPDYQTRLNSIKILELEDSPTSIAPRIMSGPNHRVT